jgi:hypothetical protein
MRSADGATEQQVASKSNSQPLADGRITCDLATVGRGSTAVAIEEIISSPLNAAKFEERFSGLEAWQLTTRLDRAKTAAFT